MAAELRRPLSLLPFPKWQKGPKRKVKPSDARSCQEVVQISSSSWASLKAFIYLSCKAHLPNLDMLKVHMAY